MTSFDRFLSDFLAPLAAEDFSLGVGSLAAYLDTPAAGRSGDEASVVDARIARRFIMALGYEESEMVYNLGTGQLRPDYLVCTKGATRPHFIIEDKNTAVTDLEGNLPQLQGYLVNAGCTLGVLLNGRWLVLYQVAGRKATATQRLDLLEAVRCWQGTSLFAVGRSGAGALTKELRDVLEAVFLRLQREAFIGVEALVRDLVEDRDGHPHAQDGSSWPSKARIAIRHFPAAGVPVAGEESTTADFIEEVKVLLHEAYLDAASQLRAALEEAEEHDRQVQVNPLNGQAFSDGMVRAWTDLETFLKAAGADAALISIIGDELRGCFDSGFGPRRRREIEAHQHSALGKLPEGKPRRDAGRRAGEILAAVFSVITAFQRRRNDLGSHHASALAIRRQFESWRTTTGAVLGQGKTEEQLRGEFATQTAYVLFVRFLVLRVAEDKGLIPRVFTNGGVAVWFHFVEPRFLSHATGRSAGMLLDLAYQAAGHLYPQFYDTQPVFDWFAPDRKLVVRLLHRLAGYDFEHIDDDVIGHLYQGYVEANHRHEMGMYYTPPALIEMMLDAAGYRGPNVIGRKLLDPACGSGAFLVGACRRLLAAYREHWAGGQRTLADLSVEEVQAVLDELSESLHGLELNPFACYLAETNLLIQVFGLVGPLRDKRGRLQVKRFSIHNTDTLLAQPATLLCLDGLAAPAELPEAEQIKTRLDRFQDGFDFIVANPPYVRADESAAILEYRRRVESLHPFAPVVELLQGRWDLFVPFVGLGMELLRDGGRLAMITSTGMGQPYAEALRESMAARLRLDEVHFFTKVRLFTGVQVENVVFVATKIPAPPAHEVPTEWHEAAPPAAPVRREQRLQARFGGRVLRRQDLALRYRDTTPMRHVGYISKGMALHSDEKRFPGEFKKDDLIAPRRDANHPQPYVEGKDIEPYLLTDVRWLEYGPGLRAPAKVSRETFAEIYTIPKLMRGETSGAWLDEGRDGWLLANHSVYLLLRWADLEDVTENLALRKAIREAGLPRARLEDVSRDFDRRFLLALLNNPTALSIAQANASSYLDEKFEPNSLKTMQVPNASRTEQADIAERVTEVLNISSSLSDRRLRGWKFSLKKHLAQAPVLEFLRLLADVRTKPWVRVEPVWRIHALPDALAGKIAGARHHGTSLWRGKATRLVDLPADLPTEAAQCLCRLLNEQPEGQTLSEARVTLSLPASPEEAVTLMAEVRQAESDATDAIRRRETLIGEINDMAEWLYAARVGPA